MNGSTKAGTGTTYQEIKEKRGSADTEAKSSSAQSDGANAFGTIYVSVVLAIIGTVYLAVAKDLPWVWWLPAYIGIGAMSFVVIFAAINWKKN